MTHGADVSVECSAAADGWQCRVTIRDAGSATQHDVAVSPSELARYAEQDTTPEDLVAASFRFLLEREPKESILRSFRLSEIERYFPEYRAQIGRSQIR